MPSVSDILHEHGISVRNHSGTQRTTCPECSPHRRKKTDPCLSVTFDGRGVLWNCWHCGHHGAALCEPETRPALPDRWARPTARAERPTRASLSQRTTARRPSPARHR